MLALPYTFSLAGGSLVAGSILTTFWCDDEVCEMPVTVYPPLKAAVHKGFGAGQYVGGWCKSWLNSQVGEI